MIPLWIALSIVAACVCMGIYALKAFAHSDGSVDSHCDKSHFDQLDDCASFANVVTLNNRRQTDANAAKLLREYRDIQELPASERIEAQAAWRGRVNCWLKVDSRNSMKSTDSISNKAIGGLQPFSR